MDEIQKIISRMEPKEALDQLMETAKKLLVHLDDRERMDFVVNMIGEAGSDKIASMVDR